MRAACLSGEQLHDLWAMPKKNKNKKSTREPEPPETLYITKNNLRMQELRGSDPVWHSHLRHDFVLTLLHVLPVGLDDGRQELEVLDVTAVRFNTMDKVVDDAFAHVIAKLVVVHEDVTHGLGFQQLVGDTIEVLFVTTTQKRCKELVWDIWVLIWIQFSLDSHLGFESNRQCL